MSDIRIEFTDKELSPWGGMALMKRLIEKSGINEQLRLMDLPEQGSNRGYDPVQLINQYWLSVWSGANKFEHLEVTRGDEVLRKLFGWRRMAGHKAFMRYFRKFTQAINHDVFDQLYRWFFRQIRIDNYTLDLDSTVITRYGEQQGAKVGYNPKKRGRKSHHPLMAFVAECRMVVNCWLRSGDAHTANNFFSFLEQTLWRLGEKTIGLLRADSGFYDAAIFDYLENREKPIAYIIAARLYPALQRTIASQKTWLSLEAGIQIAESLYQSPMWKAPRRLIILRQHIPERPKAGGKPLRLFEEEGIYKNYRYSCFITNLTLPAQQIWVLYRARADSENRIKELKYDFGAESFNVNDFYATQAALNWVMMAYNLMSLFRQTVLQRHVKPTLKTLRYKVFAIGAYIAQEGNSKLLKLSLSMKRREWFKGLWQQATDFDWPNFAPG